mmetsp:Transcript_59853/g.69935  ORF Transcript_59853/g.69935 Transcript_59853/m.69935 type:complete len:170 (-) Transcript_59853:274-783(-)
MSPVLEKQARRIVTVLLSLSLAQVFIFARLIAIGDPNGALIECLSPPCKRPYVVWIAFALFSALSLSTFRIFMGLQTGNVTKPKDSFLYYSMGVMLVNLLIDVKYAHPIPHAGVSLNMLMHSNVKKSEQALTPFLSVLLSVLIMACNLLTHRILVDMYESKQPIVKKKI